MFRRFSLQLSMGPTRQRTFGIAAITLCLLCLPALSSDAATGRWSSEFIPASGIDGEVKVALEFDGDLIVGGGFRFMGAQEMNRVARWDGQDWHPMGSGFDGTVEALTLYRGRLVAGGSFQHSGANGANFVAVWDGQRWTPFGSGMNNSVYSLDARGDTLVAGGIFTEAGDVRAKYVAAWDGLAWRSVGDAAPLPDLVEVFGVAQTDEGVFAAQRTRDWDPCVDGVPFGLDYILSRSTTSGWEEDAPAWEPPSTYVHVYPQALRVDGESILVAGYAEESNWDGGGLTYGTRVYRRDYGYATPLGGWLPQSLDVYSIGRYRGDLILSTQSGLFRLEGENWAPFPVPPPFKPGVMTTWRDRLVACSGSSLATWDGESWSALVGWSVGQGLDNAVLSLATTSEGLFVSGEFTHGGSAALRGCALRNGASWSDAPSTRGPLHPMHAVDDTLYASGVSGCDTGCGSIHRWDGREWLPVFDSPGRFGALATHEGCLVATGSFDSVTGPGQNIAIRRGASWFPLGSGLPQPGSALVSYDGLFYAACSSSNRSRSQFLRWDGVQWRPFADSLGLAITKMVGYQGRVVAAGWRMSDYDYCRDRPIYEGQVLRWERSGWSPLGGPFNGKVHSMAVFHSDLVAAGAFTRAGGEVAAGLARWDGANWRPFGGGVDGEVVALWVDGDSLWIGGTFHHAGNLPSYDVGLWYGQTPSVSGFAARLVAPDSVALSWNRPPDGAISGLVLRYARGDFPVDPADGEAVPNGHEGLFEVGGDAPVSFMHGVTGEGGPYYYSGFLVMEDGGYSVPVHGRVDVPDQLGPSLSLSLELVPDPASQPGTATAHDSVSVLLTSSERIEPGAIHARYGDQSILMQSLDLYGTEWAGRTALRSPGGSAAASASAQPGPDPGLLANALDHRGVARDDAGEMGTLVNVSVRASDKAGNGTEVSRALVARRLTAAFGGAMASADGAFHLDVLPQALAEDALLSVRAALGQDAGRQASAVQPTYQVEPDVALARRALVTLTFARSGGEESRSAEGSGAEGAALVERPVILQNGQPLLTTIDVERGLAFASVSALGTFQLSWEASDSTRPGDLAFLAFHSSGRNPFRDEARLAISVELPQAASLEIFDVTGRRVRQLRWDLVVPGVSQVVWNGRDDEGRPVVAGVYLCRARTETASARVRLVKIP